MALGFYGATACLCVFVAVLSLDIMGFFSRKNHFDVERRTVIVTGGSQGMGRGLGKLLAQKGAHVVIVARNKDKLDEALEYISSSAKSPQTQRFHTISADVTKPEENTRIIAEVTEWNHGQPPDIVWANVGSSHPDLFVDASIETLRSQMDINYWSAAYLAQAVLKSWLKPSTSTPADKDAKPRHFIMTSSVACFVGLAGYATYAPAKAAMRSLADGLRSEMNLYNGYRRSNLSKDAAAVPPADIKIHCVFPGTILSPGLEQENKTKHAVTKLLEDGDPKQTEDEVAAAAVKGLEKGGFLVSTQMLGNAMRVGMMGGSARNNWLVDTVLGWVVNLVWLFVGPDLEGKVFNYGKKNQVKLPE